MEQPWSLTVLSKLSITSSCPESFTIPAVSQYYWLLLPSLCSFFLFLLLCTLAGKLLRGIRTKSFHDDDDDNDDADSTLTEHLIMH